MRTITCSVCRLSFASLVDLSWHQDQVASCANSYRLEQPKLSIHARCFVCPWETTEPVAAARLAIRAHFDAHPSQTIAGKHVCRQTVHCQCGWVGNECSTRSDVDASISYHRGAHRVTS